MTRTEKKGRNFSVILRNKKVSAVLIASVIFLLTSLLHTLGLFEYLENKSYDARVVLLAGLTHPSDDIVLVLLDQDSLDWGRKEKNWSWPWPRDAYAQIVRYMEEGGAAAVVFDVIFTEPSLYGPADDEIFASASRDYGRVVQTLFFDSGVSSARTGTWPAGLESVKFTLKGFSETELALTQRSSALFPVAPLASAAGMLGSITGVPDSDGVCRRAFPIWQFDNHVIPALSLASLTVAERTALYEIDGKAAGDDSVDISVISRGPGGEVEWNGHSIPVNRDGAALLRFRGSLDRYIPYNAEQILRSRDALLNGEEPLLEPEMFAGKYVFFGFYAPGLYDMFATPISGTYAGAGVHITMLDNILSGDFIREIPSVPVFIYILLMSIAGVCCMFYPDTITRRLLLLALCALIIVCAAFMSYAAGYWIPLIAPLAALVLSYSASFILVFSTEGRQKRYLKSAFRQYLSPIVIEELIAHPERLKLGGERREVSIYFSDVQGFTSISENLSPEELTDLLNEYLSVMSDIIFESGGTIDKYEGDAIIAFWNAPLSQADHAAHALGAALECQRRLAELRPQFREKAGGDMFMRIGLNTGSAVVGNMGSHMRFNYTLLGDAVNLASRLEGLNKQFGTYTMCTEAMRQSLFAVPSAAYPVPFFRELARVMVVGKKEPVTVFEPMYMSDYESRAGIFPVFDTARELYYSGRFTEAADLFDTISNQDRPSFFYAQKCRSLAANPPADWTGVWQATSK